jgi:hypothetical protein
MRPLRSVSIYLAAVFLGGALLAPWLYWLTQWAGEQWSVAQRLAEEPFHRFVNRSMLGLALVGLWPFLRSLGTCSWEKLGLAQPWRHRRELYMGLALGFVSLAAVAAFAVATGTRDFDPGRSASRLATGLGRAALSALVVGVLEEALFRGALFGALRKAYPWTVALVLSSAVYAFAHFFQKAKLDAAVTWLSGLEVLARMCAGFVDVQALVPGLFALLLAGMILGLAYQRTGSLYFSIGLHAGWIFWMKSYGLVTRARPGASSWLAGSSRLIDGWFAVLVLAAVWVGLWWGWKGRESSHAV